MRERFVVVDNTIIVTDAQLREIYKTTSDYKVCREHFGNGFVDYQVWKDAQIKKGIFKIADEVLTIRDIEERLSEEVNLELNDLLMEQQEQM